MRIGAMPTVPGRPAAQRDRDRLEARRLRAAGLFTVGVRQAEVARQFGVSAQTPSTSGSRPTCRQALATRGMLGAIATRGVPAPVQASRRWPVERTHAWGNQYGKLRSCTERRRVVVEFWLALAGASIVCGRLVRRAWTCYRWDSRPRHRP
jgi:hypothetical protein